MYTSSVLVKESPILYTSKRGSTYGSTGKCISLPVIPITLNIIKISYYYKGADFGSNVITSVPLVYLVYIYSMNH